MQQTGRANVKAVDSEIHVTKSFNFATAKIVTCFALQVEFLFTFWLKNKLSQCLTEVNISDTFIYQQVFLVDKQSQATSKMQPIFSCLHSA